MKFDADSYRQGCSDSFEIVERLISNLEAESGSPDWQAALGQLTDAIEKHRKEANV